MNQKLGSLFRKPHIYVALFFILYLCLGLYVYKDYGISSDELIQRYHALVSAKYLTSIFCPNFKPPEFAQLPPLATFAEKEYGVIFDFPMYVAEVLLGYTVDKPANIYYLRHLCTFFLFFIGVFFFFLIIKNRFKSWAMGLLGCLFLILSPRFFAESFYNSKDIVFLSLFIITIYFFIRFLSDKTLINSFLFAIATAFTVDQRITGVVIPLLAVLICLIDAFKGGWSLNGLMRRLYPLVAYLISSVILVICFWPYLWENPLRNFVHAFALMSKFPWIGIVLYMGKFIKSNEIPWHYIPVWILITTPIIYTAFFIVGLFQLLREIMKRGLHLYSTDTERQDFLFLLLILVPLAAVIIEQSVLYDGWRQMYFIYAPFLLITLKGLVQIIDKRKEASAGKVFHKFVSFVVAGLIVWNVIAISYQMLRDHPFQNVYFNLLAGKSIGQNFERDYWGLSYRQGLEYIVNNDKRPIIKVAANSPIFVLNNAIFLSASDARRLALVDKQQADYFVTEYRGYPQRHEYTHEVYTISVDTIKILSVFKLE